MKRWLVLSTRDVSSVSAVTVRVADETLPATVDVGIEAGTASAMPRTAQTEMGTPGSDSTEGPHAAGGLPDDCA